MVSSDKFSIRIETKASMKKFEQCGLAQVVNEH